MPTYAAKKKSGTMTKSQAKCSTAGWGLKVAHTSTAGRRLATCKKKKGKARAETPQQFIPPLKPSRLIVSGCPT